LSITAVISLALGFYQSFRPGATNKVEWVQGVAILIAITVITVAQALNDYQQERKFMTLNEKVCRQSNLSLTETERRSQHQSY
jgi:Ca2+-transporting ATPase